MSLTNLSVPFFCSAGGQGIKGVLIVDKFGLAVENQGDFRADQSGIISSLMRNVATLS